MNPVHKPVIGIICDVFSRDGNNDRPFHGVGAEYIRAIHLGTHCTPLLIPASLDQVSDWQHICTLLDGILFTGSRTNVHPDRYAGPASKPGTLYDMERDATSLGLIKTAVQLKTPIMAICRGFQEVNVALGGTLHQNLCDIDGKQDHYRFTALPQHEQYQPAHPVDLTAGGYLQSLLGQQRIIVNTLHNQGVDQLAAPLSQEAVCDDGVIEAYTLAEQNQFLLGLQWHPEWHIDTDPVSQSIFSAFDKAVHQYAKQK